MSPPQIGTIVFKGLVCNRRFLKCEGSTFDKERALVGILSEYCENSCEISLAALLATRHHPHPHT